MRMINQRFLRNRQRGGSSGYAMLLGILILSAMLATAVTMSTLVIRETRAGTRVVEAMRALAVADSGIERALYIDLKTMPPPESGTNITSQGDANQAPFTTLGYHFELQVTKSGVCTVTGNACARDIDCAPNTCSITTTSLRSVGYVGNTQRTIEGAY